jgi:5,10-methylenetetrahydromethanopterin reductase
MGADLPRLADGVAAAHAACAAHGRDPAALRLGCYVQVAVGNSREELTRAREAIRGLVMTHSRFSAFEGRALPSVAGADEQAMRRSLDAMEAVLRSSSGGTVRAAGGAPGELEFYPRDAVDAEFVDRFAIVGDAEQCTQRLKEIVDLGITKIAIGTRGVGADLTEHNTRRIGRDVLPGVRRAAAAR